MKVVIAAYDFLPGSGGVATSEAILAKAFVDAGHDMTVVTLVPGPLEGYGHAVVRNPGPAEIFRLYREADLLILSNLAVKLIYPLMVMRRPFALRHHSESAFSLSRSLFSSDVIRRAVCARARHFVTSEYIGRVSGLADYVVARPFADPAHITPDVIQPPQDRQCALFVGRLEPEKGVAYMLDRWPLIRDRLKISELRIVGDGSLLEEVRQRIAGGLSGVTAVGRLDHKATAREMGRAAYILVPSLWEEPFGAVALEGIAAGAIPIVSNRGGLGEAVGDIGVMFDPDDAASLDTALRAASEQRERILAASDAWAAHLDDVARHVAAFQPAAGVERIVSAMFSGSRPATA